MKVFFFFVVLLFAHSVQAQYAPQAGLPGSTAISSGSSQFVAWASGCVVQRGYMDIANPPGGFAAAGDSSSATGIADLGIVSLGDSGVAVLTFTEPIYDGPGADFAVFENGFLNTANDSEAFLELAFVEVSSDGVNYFRFPSASLTPYNVQLTNADYVDARKLDNLAGKYTATYGTPFDLQVLQGTVGLDISRVTHVRLVDVIGSIFGHSSYDNLGRIINDPYPTPFPSAGFDLDAVGVIHQVQSGVHTVAGGVTVSIYPNPATDHILISSKGTLPANMTAVLTSIEGKVLSRMVVDEMQQIIPMGQCPAGMYYLILHDANGNRWVEKVTKR